MSRTIGLVSWARLAYGNTAMLQMRIKREKTVVFILDTSINIRQAEDKHT